MALHRFEEVELFGGVAFLVKGHMTVAVSPRGLLVRVGPAEHDRALKRLGTRAMEMRGRVMTGYVYVDPFPDDAQSVRSWVQSASATIEPCLRKKLIGLPRGSAEPRAGELAHEQTPHSRYPRPYLVPTFAL